jgi:glycosyltransferase involved in cell wall biosynthesis
MSALPTPQPVADPSRLESETLRVYAPTEVRLVVIVPALNESATLGRVLDAIPRQAQGLEGVQVVVVNDGSTDDTASIARRHNAEVVSHSRPFGVGAAVRSGIRKALELGADVIVNVDADGQFQPAEIPRLIAPILAGEADVVTASRFATAEVEPQMPKVKRWGNRQVSRMVSWLSGVTLYDVSCGMRAYRREAALSLALHGDFTYTHEMLLQVLRLRFRVLEMPMRIRGEREFGKSRVASSVLRYGWRAGKIMLRFVRDNQPLKFFGSLATVAAISGLTCLWTATGSGGVIRLATWPGVLGIGLLGFSGALAVLGFVGDMLRLHSLYLEDIQYYVRQTVAQRGRLL